MGHFTPDSTHIEFEDQKRDDSSTATQCFLPELQSLSTRIAAVHEISMAINRSLNLDQIFQVVGQQAKWLLDFDQCSICLCQKDNLLHLIPLFGCSTQSLDIDQSDRVRRAIASRQPQRFNEPSNDANPISESLRSQLIIPLESESEVLGTINFTAHKSQAYTQEDVRIAYLLALQLATAIRNARRFEEVNQLYSELQQAYGELRQLEGLRDELTHMIVHDLRNPLSSILVGLEMVEVMQANRTEHHHWVDMAQNASNSMIGMIDDLLRLSKLEAKKLQPILAPLEINALILERQESYRAQATTQNKILLLHLPERSPVVMADRSLTVRVIDNLVSNALKYTESRGQIEISVTSDLEMLQVSVRDDGLGVPREYCDRIFDKFVQVADSQGAMLRKGTGLRLAFCRMAIEAQGGKIWVESVDHAGSNFTFTLPLVLEQSTAEALPQSASEQRILLTVQPPISTTNHPITNG